MYSAFAVAFLSAIPHKSGWADSRSKCNISEKRRWLHMGKSYEHLNIDERAVIEKQLGFGMKPGAIAVGLIRSTRTIIGCCLRHLISSSWFRFGPAIESCP